MFVFGIVIVDWCSAYTWYQTTDVPVKLEHDMTWKSQSTGVAPICNNARFMFSISIYELFQRTLRKFYT